MSDPHDPAGAGAPSEEELRAAYEAELERITALDMIAQSAVSLLNIGARRMGPPPGAPGQQEAAGGRDLEQVRDAIDGARGLLAVLERRMPREVGPLKDALSRLQMAYATELKAGENDPGGSEPSPRGDGGGGEGGPGGSGPSPGGDGAQPQPAEGEQGGQRRPGPAESSGRLWVPGS